MFLTVPKEQICFLCHERAAMQQHVSSSKQKDCLGCHDAHRSARAMLLRRNVGENYAHSSPVAAKSNHPNTKLKSHALTKRRPQHPQAQALRPGSMEPNRQMSDNDARALTAYLMSLKGSTKQVAKK
jgi:predicted CXXCH cytochrome family protein